jgi:hypothetical protein
MWFQRLYSDPERGLGFQGCSSHSGRRTFITRAARKVATAKIQADTFARPELPLVSTTPRPLAGIT